MKTSVVALHEIKVKLEDAPTVLDEAGGRLCNYTKNDEEVSLLHLLGDVKRMRDNARRFEQAANTLVEFIDRKFEEYQEDTYDDQD